MTPHLLPWRLSGSGRRSGSGPLDGTAGVTVVTGRACLPGTIGATAAEIDAGGGRGVAVSCDHRDDDAVRRLFDQVGREQGLLDVLVNNVYDAPGSARWLGRPFWEVPAAGWDHTFAVGVRSPYVASVLAAPLLLGADQGLPGRV